MESKMYYRICSGLSDKGKLVPTTFNLQNYIKNNQDKDLYMSLYQYTEDHKQRFDELGTVAGIKDNTTNHLIFDLDNKDFDLVKKDAFKIIEKLEKKGVPSEDLMVSYSGNKGLHIEARLDTYVNESQYKKLVTGIAGGLKTFDPKITNSNRIIRLPFSKHQTSGLYKTPISIEELRTLNIEDIKKIAKQKYQPELSLNKISLQVPKEESQKVTDNNQNITEELDLDFKAKPKWLSYWKYALQNGYFPEGTRSYALMVLAATYKNQGFNKTQTYHILKAAAELQANRFNGEKFSKEEIYNNVISQVYSEFWNGGTYAEENFPDDLKQYLVDLGVPRDKEIDVNDVFKRSEDVFKDFTHFATNIDKNTLKTGIKPLDDIKDFRITTSMLVGLLGAPSSGKCHGKGTKILMYDGSIKKVEDVKVGDLIMGNDSTPRTVLNLARGREELFKVHTNDGYYTVNKSHILSIKNVQNRMISGIKTGEIKNLTVTEFQSLSKDAKRRLKGYRVPIEFKYKKPQMSPYLVGAWLGDGSTNGTVISNEDSQLYPILENEAKEFNIDMQIVNHSDKCTSLRFTTKERHNPFRSYVLNKCQDENGKRIPKDLLINSRKVRLQLLAGILDTDGYYDSPKDAFEVTFKQKSLAKDLQYLCRSLGLKCTTKECEKGIASTGFKGTYYRSYINGDFYDLPVKLKRRIPANKDKRSEATVYKIELESIGEGDYYGFELDGNHLYCLGDFSVTHNTSVSLEIMKTCSQQDQQVAFFSMDMGSPLVFQRLAQKVSKKKSEELYDLFRENDTEQINKIGSEINKQYKNVHFSFKTAMTTQHIRESLEKIQDKHGKVRLAVVDYLECISSSTSDPTAKISMISQELKDIATDLDICILLLLQPPKRVGDPSKEILSYTDIKGAATVAQACSIVLSLWREGFNPKTTDQDNYISFAAIKNRMGKLCQIDCKWDGLTGKIGYLEDIERAELADIRELKRMNNKDDDL